MEIVEQTTYKREDASHMVIADLCRDFIVMPEVSCCWRELLWDGREALSYAINSL